jgi:hypothetical protein
LPAPGETKRAVPRRPSVLFHAAPPTGRASRAEPRGKNAPEKGGPPRAQFVQPPLGSGASASVFNFGSASSHDAAPVSSGHAVQRTLEVDVATVRVGKSCDQPLHRRVGLDGSLDGVVAAMPSKCQFLLGGLFLCVKRLCRLFSTRNQPRPFQDWQQRL